jgi:hypothetical protein
MVGEVSELYRNILPETNHQFEYMMEREINKRINKYNLRAIRVEGDPSSKTDIDIFKFDNRTLQKGSLIFTIDVERKLNTIFYEDHIPCHWTNGINYLAYRKIDNKLKLDDTIYMLYSDTMIDPNIIWNTFGEIRTHGKFIKKNGRYNDVYTIPHSKKHLAHFGWESFTKYITTIDDRVNWFG